MRDTESKTVASFLWFADFKALVELDAALISPAPSAPAASSSGSPQPLPSSRTKKQALNSSDPLYASLRDVNFAVVGTVLNRVARRLSDDYEVESLRNFSHFRDGTKPRQSHRSRISLAN